MESGTSGRIGIGQSDKPQEAKIHVVLAGWQCHWFHFAFGDRQARAGRDRPLSPHACDSSSLRAGSKWHRSAIASGAPLAATTQSVPSGDSQTCERASSSTGERILTDHPPGCVQMVGARQILGPQLCDGLFHRVEGVLFAGKYGELKRPMEPFWQIAFAQLRQRRSIHCRCIGSAPTFD